MKINFELLESQIVQMKDKLLDIVNKKVNSYYQDFSIEICQQVGIRKAETPMSIMSHFKILRPGYYGSKGLILIGDVLSNFFLFNNLLAYNLVYPKKPVDYLQEVLVPETTLRLVFQNRGNIPLEEVRKIMEDSTNFGDYVHKE
ncbi:hypothetical protein C1645_838706 [Glomus cerebriforme]|uniref:Restriction of telomere capping protein 4 n=1 Tax=Glomus cerebriforme TaxID=658196 RepID=A0A397S802_9GLOM|nr:hypothetical protein C1645_838706 [Glomus cerebriforme]